MNDWSSSYLLHRCGAFVLVCVTRNLKQVVMLVTRRVTVYELCEDGSALPI